MEIKLENKDCVEFLKTLDDNSVDYINVDPPYNIGYDGGDGIVLVKYTVS